MADVLIVGGGYAGVAAARMLGRILPSEWTVTLADRRPQHELLTRLPEIVAGTVRPEFARIPYADILPSRVRFVCSEVQALDVDTGIASTASGPLRWDSLILAPGVGPRIDPPASPGASIFPLRSVDDAVALRDALTSVLARRELTRIVIIGAGYTGTEIAGELVSLPHAERRLTVTLLADAPRVLPQGNAAMARLVGEALTARGANMRLGTQIDAVTTDAVRTKDGESFPSDIVIWAGQTAAAAQWEHGFRTRDSGRVVTDEYLGIGRPNMFAVGDGAAVGHVAASAQMAIEEGKLAAGNVLRTIRGENLREFRPRSLGEALSLGPTDGVAEVLGVLLTGRRAHAAKSVALIRYLVSLGGAQLARRYAGQ